MALRIIGDPSARNKSWLPSLDVKADDGVRTRDLKLGKLALYQLSYVRAGRFYAESAQFQSHTEFQSHTG